MGRAHNISEAAPQRSTWVEVRGSYAAGAEQGARGAVATNAERRTFCYSLAPGVYASASPASALSASSSPAPAVPSTPPPPNRPS